ncbi:MAG: class I SAM-dependent methyltransferase [Solidesulfovibrio sp. DCME]|uniref:class I SAM-dependent methyltransferase n=1 Tax=Solidesulfovibrio sp. DCME TaxID=3447380 RepID=UPI003D0E91DD
MKIPNRRNGEEYRNLTFTEDDINKRSYMDFLGGGNAEWDQRGLAQAIFLKKLGLMPENILLDVGCGPGRAGRYLVNYLNKGNYCGIDYNKEFLDIFQNEIVISGLSNKNPSLCVTNIASLNVDICADYVLVFSVLNHCTKDERQDFLSAIPHKMSSNGRMYMTHCGWLNEEYDIGPDLLHTNSITDDNFRVFTCWKANEGLFPIIELRKIDPSRSPEGR